MAQQNATGQPQLTREGLMEYFASILQNGTFPPQLTMSQSSSPSPSPSPSFASPVPTSLSIPPPSSQPRSFNRLGRGTGGALAEKKKVSKLITASASKRKSLVDPDIEDQLEPVPEVAQSSEPRKAKRPKPTPKGTGRRPQKPRLPVLPPGSPHAIPNPISTPTPPTPVRPVSRSTRPRVKAQPLQPTTPNVPPVSTDEHVAETQEIESDEESDGSNSEVEVLAPTGNHRMSTPVQSQNPMSSMPPISLLQAYLTQVGGPYIPAQQVQPPPASQLQPKTSKGIRGYPDGWRKVLNSAKDIVRTTILLKDPFPAPGQVRITVNECFHEALTTECQNGLVLEPGHSWSDSMMSILLNEVSTCRGELKKLAQILVKSDPEIFPSPENNEEPLWNKPAPEIRVIAAKLARQPAQLNPPHNPVHIQTSVASRRLNFAFLNNPPTVFGDLLANPILAKLCQSFYEEEKWQRSLMLQVDGDNKWVSSVPLVMVALAATAYSNALDEWQSGHLVVRPFEIGKYSKTFNDISNHITYTLTQEAHSEQIADRFRVWAEESSFVQGLYEEASEDE